MQRNSLDILQRPAQPRRRQTEGRWRRVDIDLTRRKMARKGSTNAVKRRVSGCEHAYVLAASRKNGVDAEGCGPRVTLAMNEAASKLQVALSAEHMCGVPDGAALPLTKAGDAVFTKTDNCQPSCQFWLPCREQSA